MLNLWYRLLIFLARNWGLPYHFIFCFFLTAIFGHWFNPAWVSFGVIVFATLYEVYQFKTGNNNNFDFAGDMIANMLGVAIGNLFI